MNEKIYKHLNKLVSLHLQYVEMFMSSNEA
jgi:hypothetical protein